MNSKNYVSYIQKLLKQEWRQTMFDCQLVALGIYLLTIQNYRILWLTFHMRILNSKDSPNPNPNSHDNALF